MQFFNFSRLVNKYKSEIKAITFSESTLNDNGDWVKGEKTEITLQGAVISHRESKIMRSEGSLSTKDKRLFTLEPINKALQGSKVIFEGNVYGIEENTDNAKFTGVYAYTLKWVSAFKEDSGE